mgnify:CR=1 FL=1
MTMYVRFMMVVGAIALTTTPGLAQVLARATPAAGEGVAADTGDLWGPVRIPRRVTTNSATLAPGTYSVRITGETSEQDRWVEFVSGGRVAARELATVIPAVEIRSVAKVRPPPAGEVRVETLSGADYVRVWINDGGVHYLIHLPQP